MTFRAIVHPAEEGGYWAEIPALPGCMTEAETIEELQANLLEAVHGWTEAATEQAHKLAAANSFEFALAA
jgi:predicted RNase H-like HicB family nuclease